MSRREVEFKVRVGDVIPVVPQRFWREAKTMSVPSAGVMATVEPDPLGDVNMVVKLHTLGYDGWQFRKAALAPVRDGDMVIAGSTYARDDASYMYEDVALAYLRFTGPVRYYVEHNGRRIIEWQHDPPSQPKTTARQRIRLWRYRIRNGFLTRIADPLMERLGYESRKRGSYD